MKNMSRSDLNKDYKKAYEDMELYLRTKHLTGLIQQDIMEDILGIALEGQAHGLTPQETFGDLQPFCDEISVNAKPKTKKEQCLIALLILIQLLVLIILFFLTDAVLSEYSYLSDGILHVSMKNVTYNVAYIAIIFFIQFYYFRLRFHKIIGTWYAAVIVIVLLLSISDAMKSAMPNIMFTVPLWLLIPAVLIGIVCYCMVTRLQKKQFQIYKGNKVS